MMRKITANWSVDIDDTFRRRTDDGSLVFWASGRTVWIDCWGDGTNPSKAEAIKFIRSDAASDAKWILDGEDDAVYRLVYALTEVDENGTRYAGYSFTIVEGQYLQMAVYFDALSDQDWALNVIMTPQFHSDQH